MFAVSESSSAESPIYKVPDDLLFKIFSINASRQRLWTWMEKYDAPVTLTRHSSQVCKHWRHLVLGSPSLWGILLNLNDLISGSNEWRNEVLSRTKQAMLHVRLSLEAPHQVATSFLLKILDEEWPRIQHLDISICGEGDYDDDRWLSIHRPTENLRSISLHFQPRAPEPLRSTSSVLFAGRAPSLRSVIIRRVDFQLEWFSQLSTLHLLGQFEPEQLIKPLSDMPFLETLEILGLRFGNPHLQWPKIILPRLKNLLTHGDLAPCLMLLDHIIPSPGCGLGFSNNEDQSITDQDLSTAARVLSRYCEGYFKTYISQSIQLILNATAFSFCHLPGGDTPSLDVRICNSDGFSSIALLFKPLLSCPFSDATSIFFVADDNLPPDPNFSKFISLLYSVNDMDTTPASLQYLCQIQTGGDVAFLPSLTTIHPAPVLASSVAVIMDFLLWLKSSGGSIQCINVGSQVRLAANWVDLSPLEQFSGLRVVWTATDTQPMTQASEYLCGSGTPEMIDFRPLNVDTATS